MASRETEGLLRRLLEKIYPEEKLDRMIELLTSIKDLLTVAPPPAGAVTIANLVELRDMIVDAKAKYGQLRLADDLYVETIDLGTARATPTDYSSTLAVPQTVALTIFRCTGTFDLYLQKADNVHKITFDAITYPQTFLLDWFTLTKAYIVNTAQSGKSAVIIAWRKTS